MSQKPVFDAGSLIAAAKTEVNSRLVLDDVLLYARVVIPAHVRQETVDQGLRQGYVDAVKLDRRIRQRRIEVLTPSLADPVFDGVASA